MRGKYKFHLHDKFYFIFTLPMLSGKTGHRGKSLIKIDFTARISIKKTTKNNTFWSLLYFA